MKEQGYEVDESEVRQHLESLPAQTAAAPLAHVLPGASDAGVPMSRVTSPNIRGDRECSPTEPLDLRHTAILSAEFAQEQCSNWNALVDAGLRDASGRGIAPRRLREVAGVNIVEEHRNDSGFHPVSGTNWSYQNKDANGAWRAAYALAVELKQSIKVRFQWRNNEKAAFPNETATMRWVP